MGRHGLHLLGSNAWEKHHEFPIYGVRSQLQMNRLTSKLAQLQQPTDRLHQLVYEIKICPQAFSGDQIITLAPYFPGTELVLALHLLDNHIFGLRCDQAAQLLKVIPVPEQRLDALQVIDENLLDPVNRFQLRDLFPPYLLPQVDQTLADVRGQSHVYGSITSSRVIFLIDTSGSMSTEFQTDCGQWFNRLEYLVHDLHKILHHRVQPGFKFNIIHFGTHVHCWKPTLTLATSHHLKQAEHYLDHLEPAGHTNTHDALKLALSDEEADTIYLLSDGEPSTDIRNILFDLKVWLQRRRNPCVIHTVAFLMGHTQNDPKAREFLAEIAAISGGVFRCLDPFTPLHQEFGVYSYSDNPNFNDDEFVQFFEGRLRDVPPQLLQNVGLYRQQQYPSSTMGTGNTPYQTQPPYPGQQNPSFAMGTGNTPYQTRPPYPGQQNPSSAMGTGNTAYQTQPPYPGQQNPSSAMGTGNSPYQAQPPYSGQQNLSSAMGTGNSPYQAQPPYSGQQNPSSTMSTGNNPYQTQPPYSGQQNPSWTMGSGNNPYQTKPPYPGQQNPSSGMGTGNTPYQAQPPYPGQQNPSSGMGTGNTPYQAQPPYPGQQNPSSSMGMGNNSYQTQPPYPGQQNPSSGIGAGNTPYQTQPPYPGQQNPSLGMGAANTPYQTKPPYSSQQNPSSVMGTANYPYQKQPSYPVQQNSPPNFKAQLKSRPRLQDEISVPSYHHEHGHDRFDISLNIRQIVPKQDGHWSVSHTYDEFKQLHHQLEKRCTVPPFPPSHHSALHLNKQIHEQRRQELENYIKQLYVYVSPYEHPEFDVFLLMDLHVNQIIQKAEIEWKTNEQVASSSSDEEPPPPYNY